MNIILTLLLALMPAAFFLVQVPNQSGQSKDNPSVSADDLRKAPTDVVLNGSSVSLSAYPWRDFMPTTFPSADGSPMMVVLKVVTADEKPLPSGIRIDRAWVLYGEQVWEVSEFRERRKNLNDEDSWINCAASPACEVTIRGGPKWGPGVYVDVVVRLTDKEGRHHLLKVLNRWVEASS